MSAPSPTRQMFFTSWQFVAQGGFAYRSPEGKAFWANSDSDEGAGFVPNVPHGVRLAAQPPERREVLPEEPIAVFVQMREARLFGLEIY
ncbi:MAG: hypothetical protein HYU36_13265 [Planctomycetes bacterium]|nr:hypothetical protein [Planctomycetota bacterium]